MVNDEYTPLLDEDAYFRNLCEDYAKARDAWWAADRDRDLAEARMDDAARFVATYALAWLRASDGDAE